tara:strand:+ start:410 stop:805 length:396 start_codon:yes stop_codon:yes gene_type:complete
MESDMQALEALMWFFGGIFSYRIVSKLLNYGHMINSYREIMFSSLMLLKLADENFSKVNETVRETSIKNGDSDLQAETEYNSNMQLLEVWRNLNIATIIQLTPRGFQGLIKFKNWSEAMSLLKAKGGPNGS